MSSEHSLELKLLHLEDQVYRMNLVLADQSTRLEDLTTGLSTVMARLRTLEQDSDFSGTTSFHGPSETPPDGVNR